MKQKVILLWRRRVPCLVQGFVAGKFNPADLDHLDTDPPIYVIKYLYTLKKIYRIKEGHTTVWNKAYSKTFISIKLKFCSLFRTLWWHSLHINEDNLVVLQYMENLPTQCFLKKEFGLKETLHYKEVLFCIWTDPKPRYCFANQNFIGL